MVSRSLIKCCAPHHQDFNYRTANGTRTRITTLKGWWTNLLFDGSVYKDKNIVSAKVNSYDELITAL